MNLFEIWSLTFVVNAGYVYTRTYLGGHRLFFTYSNFTEIVSNFH